MHVKSFPTKEKLTWSCTVLKVNLLSPHRQLNGLNLQARKKFYSFQNLYFPDSLIKIYVAGTH